jgi:hypothetical protein
MLSEPARRPGFRIYSMRIKAIFGLKFKCYYGGDYAESGGLVWYRNAPEEAVYYLIIPFITT